MPRFGYPESPELFLEQETAAFCQHQISGYTPKSPDPGSNLRMNSEQQKWP